MLVLSRKINESICIGDHVELTVLEVSGDQVKIGIQAPKSVDIIRKEIIEMVEKENKQAVESLSIDSLKALIEQKNQS
ncbi:carbon storage regulator CsrA [Shouchella sp. 1P09AA]|uniref:carbon storage regulator CsrA n=1 Tax=unclassified Shouchella TaxID=2893065 RepID=UPI0039A10AE4